MTIAVLLAAIIAAAFGLWAAAIPLMITGIILSRIDLQPARPTRPVTDLRKRQLDTLDEIEP